MLAPLRGFLFAGRPQRLAVVGQSTIRTAGKYWGILFNQSESALQNRSRRSPVLLKYHQTGGGEVAMKQPERRAGCTAETIDRLVGITHSEDISSGAGEASENLDLREIRVLKLIGQDETGTRTCFRQYRFIGIQEGVGARDHMAEASEVIFQQPTLHCREHPRDLPTAAQNFGVVEGILRSGDALHGDFATLQPLHVVRIFLGRNQFIVAAADEIQQIIQKLGNVGGPDIMLEMQLADTAAEVDPEVFLVENPEVFVLTLEQVQAIVVEGGGVDLFSAAQQVAQTLLHFEGSVVRIRESEDFVRLRVPFPDQVLNAMRQYRRFARSSAGHDQHWTVEMLNRFALTVVWSEGSGTRIGLRRPHLMLRISLGRC